MSNTYMFTGFPGYLASAIIEDIFRNDVPIQKIYLLHLPATKKQALEQLTNWHNDSSMAIEKIELIEGDISKPELGLSNEQSQKLQQEVTHFFHLAALYDLATPLTPAWMVNVQGTREVQQWLVPCGRLVRYIYFSTAYVSGNRVGCVYETELQHNEGFKNHYEYTKYEAERLVVPFQDMIPTTIIRPGIVVGHTESGVTAKFDGPYFILNMLEVLKKSPVLPFFGKGEARVNLVPQDYVIRATTCLAHHPDSQGKTYHLTDPNPYMAREIYECLSHVYADKRPRFTVPISLAKQSLRMGALRKSLGIQRESLDYFLSGAEYDSSLTQKDLYGSGIFCPDFFSYVDVLVAYYRNNKEDRTKHVSLL